MIKNAIINNHLFILCVQWLCKHHVKEFDKRNPRLECQAVHYGNYALLLFSPWCGEDEKQRVLGSISETVWVLVSIREHLRMFASVYFMAFCLYKCITHVFSVFSEWLTCAWWKCTEPALIKVFFMWVCKVFSQTPFISCVMVRDNIHTPEKARDSL